LEEANQLKNIKAIRAVASYSGKNPIWIVIPCHRTIGSDVSLTDIMGCLAKKWMLEPKSRLKQQSLF
jgi:methylated-DNA-[protein]-cysteine S-methyltransferase|tara:strand:+ start:762 stop:962 length:201 start_codon:yes stop_codon:yes gene_type:complete